MTAARRPLWLAVAVVACALVTASVQAGELPHWTAPPSALTTGSARNPALAHGGGAVHLVYRLRAGGLGHQAWQQAGGFTTPQLLIPGTSSSAANAGSKSYPAVDVDAAGRAHLAWAPPSQAPGGGAYYACIGPAGELITPPQQITDRWVEYLSVRVGDGQIHVLVTAIGNLEPQVGLYDLHAPVDGGPFSETQAWFAPIFFELQAVLAPWDGLAVIGRDSVLRRIDSHFTTSTWDPRVTHQPPAAVSSIGRPRLAFDGASELWATVGWAGTTPSGVWTSDGAETSWQQLSTEPLYDPQPADGEPLAALASTANGERAVAWLAANGPRLRLSLGRGAWGPSTALAGTEAASSFAMDAQDQQLALVWANEDGALYLGMVALLRDLGDGCTAADECASSYCADGVCCDDICGHGASDGCQVCSQAAGASSDGVCEALDDGSAATSCWGTCYGGWCQPDGAGGEAGGTGAGGTGAGGLASSGNGPAESGGCGCRAGIAAPRRPSWLWLLLPSALWRRRKRAR